METLSDIRNILPHREPMLMVDAVTEMSDEKVTTTFTILPENIFAANGVFAESGITEHCAQTSGLILGQSMTAGDNTRLIGFIANIKKIEFFGSAKTGDTLISSATMVSKFENICQVSCETFVDNILLMRAEISMYIQEVPK